MSFDWRQRLALSSLLRRLTGLRHLTFQPYSQLVDALAEAVRSADRGQAVEELTILIDVEGVPRRGWVSNDRRGDGFRRGVELLSRAMHDGLFPSLRGLVLEAGEQIEA